MKKSSPYTFDLVSSLSSVFDVGGFIYFENNKPLSKGLDYDMKQLSNDQLFLAEDYRKACDRLRQEIEELTRR